MIELIYGGSGSGKSEYAEKIAMSYSENRIYLATMKVYGDEGVDRVKKHRKLRAGKGFETIEASEDIAKILHCSNVTKNSVVLLECLSNLVANEMFTDSAVMAAEYVIDKILQDIFFVERSIGALIIVSNNVFEAGLDYDESTLEYLKALGKINEELATASKRVTEVVAGIPVTIK